MRTHRDISSDHYGACEVCTDAPATTTVTIIVRHPSLHDVTGQVCSPCATLVTERARQDGDSFGASR